jgi:hypothetical protein
MVDELFIMIAAVLIAIGIMLVSAGVISDFVNRHLTVKMLALAFPAADRGQPGRRGLRRRIAQGIRLRPDRVRDPGGVP